MRRKRNRKKGGRNRGREEIQGPFRRTSDRFLKMT